MLDWRLDKFLCTDPASLYFGLGYSALDRVGGVRWSSPRPKDLQYGADTEDNLGDWGFVLVQVLWTAGTRTRALQIMQALKT